jgi:Pyridoxamine 5'-phosphate oxidase
MTSSQAQQMQRSFWQIAPELPPEVFEAWHKPNLAISPVAIVATTDPDGAPRAVPFGSLRAITPRLLRLCSFRGHDTYANLCRDGRVTVVMISPPDISASVCGRARVVREHMKHDKDFAVLDIDIEQVKNDMAYRIVIESGIIISAKERFQSWYDAAMAELEDVECSAVRQGDEECHSQRTRP